jgi:hypothetical protein
MDAHSSAPDFGPGTGGIRATLDSRRPDHSRPSRTIRRHRLSGPIGGESIPWLARLLAVAVAHAESNLEPKLATEMISQGSGTAFDPEAVRIFLRTAPKMVVPGKQRVVPLADLRPGMVLAEGIYSENGMLLIPDGQRLTATYIDKLLNFNRINPIAQTLLVYC